MTFTSQIPYNKFFLTIQEQIEQLKAPIRFQRVEKLIEEYSINTAMIRYEL